MFTIEFDTGESSGRVSFPTIAGAARFLEWLNEGLFSVTLVFAGEQKIQAIKIVRDATGLGLKEAKDLVESVPKQVGGLMTEAAAKKLVARLEAIGATAKIEGTGGKAA